MNIISLESLIRNLQSHEIKLIEDELIKKWNSIALKFVDHYAKSYQDWKYEKPTHEEDSKEDSKDEEMSFIIKRFQYLANKKNKRFSGRCNDLRGFNSRINKDD